MKLLIPAAFALGAACSPAIAVDLSGTIDLRAVSASGSDSWTRAGLGKLRYDSRNDGLRLGQAILRADAELADTVGATLIVDANDERSGLVDVTEAWVRWNPVPAGPWKASVRAGAFFPALSLENDGPGWTPTRSASTSAINSWIGEELRTVGIEASFLRRGRPVGSPHDMGLTVAVHKANDPIGTLLAWRGWSISDRISGLREPLTLADLPVYRPDGQLPRQSRTIHMAREIDGRLGYQAAANYGYSGWLELSAMHYDNRANPLVVHDGQYAWRTRFNHAGARIRRGQWEFLMQAMRGYTAMGRPGAAIDFWAAYLMATRRIGQHSVSLRAERFGATENDLIPSDPNGEQGHALALAYVHQLAPSWSLVAEAVALSSTRPARLLSGDAARQREHSVTTALRFRF
ncbi:MAG: hypothetical protein Q7S67_03520 [Telluria sp.]|nr:hypothetical protein [Telluria sp.]